MEEEASRATVSSRATSVGGGLLWSKDQLQGMLGWGPGPFPLRSALSQAAS